MPWPESSGPLHGKRAGRPGLEEEFHRRSGVIEDQPGVRCLPLDPLAGFSLGFRFYFDPFRTDLR